jgi:hypothetical protein
VYPTSENAKVLLVKDAPSISNQSAQTSSSKRTEIELYN